MYGFVDERVLYGKTLVVMSRNWKYYDRKICPNGHSMYWESKSPRPSEEFCEFCGESNIDNCPSCQKSLIYKFTGRQSVWDGSLETLPMLPKFCNYCGDVLPWIKAKHQRIEDSGYWSLLHGKVKAVAKQRVESGNYADAVFSTFRELEKTVKNIAGNEIPEELNGQKLMRKVLT